MKKSEFICSFASKRETMTVYAEMPDGHYEYISANPQVFIPYLNYALEGIKRFGKPLNAKTLDEQFAYVVSEWLFGKITVDNGKIRKVREAEDRARLREIIRETIREYIPKDYLEMVERMKQQCTQPENGKEYEDEPEYGPSNPWDAPGMKPSDFVRGCR